MPDSDESEINSELIDSLLALPTSEEQSAILDSKKLLNSDGLLLLLNEAAYLTGGDPGKARSLAILCGKLAEGADAPVVVPRATYIRAQTYAINAEYETALILIKSAREGYEVLGQKLPALRTNLGLIHVLQELGRYSEALDAGKVILDELGEVAKLLETAESSPERVEMAATAYQNSGRCYEQMGLYSEALRAYDSAEKLLIALNMSDRIGDINNNRGIIFLRLGRGGDALDAFEKAASVFTESEEVVYRATVQGNIGEACLLLGNYTRGLESFERARRLLAPLEALAEKQVLLLDMADAYLTLNLYTEALAAYREAGSLLQTSGMTYHQARALWGIGSALLAQLHYEEAGQVLAEAEALFSGTNNIPMLCNVMLEQASLLAARGDQKEALVTANKVLALASDDDWPVQQAYAHMRIADLSLLNMDQAQMHLWEAQKLSEPLALPHLRFRLNQRLGHLNLLLGKHEEAERILKEAADEIEQSRGVLSQEMVRTSFIRDKTAIYEDLVQLYLARGDEENIRQAFAMVERAKSRTLVDLLTGIVDARADTPPDLELTAKLQTSQTELNSVYNELLSSNNKAEVTDRYSRAVKLEQEINRLRLQVSAATPQNADQFDTAPSFDILKEQFPLDKTLLAYYMCGDEILAFVNLNGKLRVIRHMTTVTAVQQQLQKLALQWDRFRGDRDFIAKHLPQLEQSTRRILRSLYDGLIAPLKTLLPAPASEGAVPSLVIVPHGALHQVPFHALFDGENYLIDHYEISYVPSQTVWTLCQKRTPAPANKALIFGVADHLIPAAVTEAQAVAKHLENASVHIDAPHATLATFQAEAPGCTVLHLACHGMFRADNPMFSSLKLYDGWLMAADVMQLDLTGALVTLSACESGRSQVIPGDEILGLARAFLGAGASTLVVSLWLVQDETTAILMETWYKGLRSGVNRAAALRVAQLAAKETHPHPYYWAPFILVGQP